MSIWKQDEISAHLTVRSGKPVAVRAIGWPEFENLPAGSWCWLDSGQLRAPGRFSLYLCEIMEVDEPRDSRQSQCDATRKERIMPSYAICDDRISPTPDVVTADELRDYLASMNELNDWQLDLDTLDVDHERAAIVIDGVPTRIATANEAGR